ncbi:GNAT family N-acetyltransferase [Agrococcus jejuensis]|uniref:Phosphinothricin acetyltransferase n=1 Tax=Agrococcus jejuensis TaxID=399736 RepID=A0A1G8B083_9MICO|nr:GNAT family N-acetyltransferase [Agrococcus jejuensis]SDH26597.1 phosphinothricin acetyltransferase [Agrococcus jejuensis]
MLPEEYDKRRSLPRHLRPVRAEPEFSFVIRPATVRDIAAVRAIHAHYVLNSSVTLEDRPKTLLEWRRTFDGLERLRLPFLVAESGTKTVLGYALAEPWKPRSAYRTIVEHSIFLAPASTGRGLGKALLVALVDAATDAGCKEMIAVIADEKAEASVALHERLGFRETGRMGKVGFKFDRWLGTITMTRRLKKRRR